MTSKQLRKEIEQILDVVYENGKEGLSKDRTLFFNGSNLFALVTDLIENKQGWGEAQQTEDQDKKKAPHWMDCNCVCHGFHDNDAPTCPHCRPELYQNYEVEGE